MKRFIRLCLLTVILGIFAVSMGQADPQKISGVIEAGSVQILLKNYKYAIDKELNVRGTLIIEPGAEILFYSNGRIVVSAGGRLIADGFARAEAKQPVDPKIMFPSTDGGLEYADMRYFLYPFYNGNSPSGQKSAGIYDLSTRERTVNPLKNNHIFNVAIDISTRKVVNIANPYDFNWPNTANIGQSSPSGEFLNYNYAANANNSNLVIVPFETALMFVAARLDKDVSSMPQLKTEPWSRGAGVSSNIVPGKIVFKGQLTLDNSVEWGHIVVMPGARAAFFRNCEFVNFKKDTTVDRINYYTTTAELPKNLNTEEFASLNKMLLTMSNGGGGAITTFSSRTWLVNCDFNNNSARNRGGALQILQTPTNAYYPGYHVVSADTANIGRYPYNKNLRVVDPDSDSSSVIARQTGYPYIDNIDGDGSEYFTSDVARMPWDDARLAGYLGRFRSLTFDNNMARLAVTGTTTVDGETVVGDNLDVSPEYPLPWGNMAYGGAIYVAGIQEEEHRQIEFGFGINDSIKINNSFVNPNLKGGRDYFKMTNNSAVNLQKYRATDGAKGGAIYVGKNTSLIVDGEFDSNITDAKFLVDTTGAGTYNNGNPTAYENGVQYSLGGAIYANEESGGRLQIRGAINKDNFTMAYDEAGVIKYKSVSNYAIFSNNRAGAGGAVYVDHSEDEIMSPVVGGSDYKAFHSDFGYRIRFVNNYAYSAGGAIFTKRAAQVTGSGGYWKDYSYSPIYAVQFDSNAAGYAGGALHVEIPNSDQNVHRPHTRLVNLVRTDFNYNEVGEKASSRYYNEIRGGGAVYTMSADLNVVKATYFNTNTVYNGNGGGVVCASPYSTNKRMFLTDLDSVIYAPAIDNDGKAYPWGVQRIATGYVSKNNPFTFGADYPSETGLKDGIVANVRMLTRFNNNTIVVNDSIVSYQLENFGNTQIGKGYVMPVTNFVDQWWLTKNSGFLAGSNGYLVKAYKNASNKWVWENVNVGDDHSYTAIQFVDGGSVGYLGDNYGSIKRTTDGGTTWPNVYTTTDITNNVINDINFLGDKGIAVTERGRIITTTNGTAWTKYSKEYNYALKGAAWSNNNTGYVVGERGLILKTSNGGADWSEQPIPGLNRTLNKILFTSLTKGFAVGNNGTMIYTIDGGNTWEVLLNQFPVNEHLTAISFYGQDRGYVASSTGEIYHTTDAGTTWTALGIANGKPINSLYYFDMNNGFATSNSALVRYTTDGSATWNVLVPNSEAMATGNPHLHAHIPGLVENGTGLGGALYILDQQKQEYVNRTDSVFFNRVRFTDNFAVTGSAIYSDNYDLKLVLNRSLVIGNKTDTRNYIGRDQNAINGPYNKSASYSEQNLASSDLAAATIYGEMQGPLPNSIFSSAANSIYKNEARFLIRLPDGPNTKGLMAGQGFLGSGGTDTLRGNYWGKTEANVVLNVLNLHKNNSGTQYEKADFETFFIAYGDDNYLPFYHNAQAKADDPRKQGPFEWNTADYPEVRNYNKYNYVAIDLNNDPTDVTKAAPLTIPEKYLFSSGIYDLFDKGTDIKTADYSQRRMVPIEDFAIGNPVEFVTYVDPNDARANLDKKTKYVKRWIRDPEYANALTPTGLPLYPEIARMQSMWKPMALDTNIVEADRRDVPRYYHPLAMPIYLEAEADLSGDDMKSNWDIKHQTETVFFVINETTTDYIRVTLKQEPNTANSEVWDSETFRATVFLVPDSSKRGDPLSRRLSENLYNLGSNGTFPFGSTSQDAGTGGSASAAMLKLLCPRETDNNIYKASHNEDFAALTGRKYIAQSTSLTSTTYDYQLGGIPNIYSNRPSMPEDNEVNVGGSTQYNNAYFAGERFGVLPANKGDVIRVVSRTVLWKEGVDKAYDGGLVFIVTDGPEAPVFTGDIVTLGTPDLNPYMKDRSGSYPPIYSNVRPDTNGSYLDTAVIKKELLNKVFLQTNRVYPASKGTYSNNNLPDNVRGIDNILTITAIDRNGFYDPRAEMEANKYTDLTYTWTVKSNSGLRYWLMADTVKADKTPIEGARGYVELKGEPLNPYIVPGGEIVTVAAFNYPPGYWMIDSLKKMPGMTQEIINMYYKTFPRYFNTPFYYGDNTDNPTGELMARFLQQDTIGYGANSFVTRADDIHIFVGDSLPNFIAYDPTGTAAPDVFNIKKDNTSNLYDTRPYSWTEYQAGVDKDNRVRANLTDRLRFKIDLNTDDELEDLSAEEKGWDFRYGRTAYSFANLAVTTNGDEVIVDTLYDKSGNLKIVSQLKPVWMPIPDVNDPNTKHYFKKYSDYNSDDDDLVDLQVRGQMNIRIDRDEALELLKIAVPNSPDRLAYNTDTVFALVANDGHGGVSTKLIDVLVNFQPEIVTETLPDAIEQIDYNPTLLDTVNARILVFDANANQKHEFELLYPGQPVALNGGSDELYVDPFFKDEITMIDLAPMKTTPTWLKINKESGILYGTPDGVVDYDNNTATVSVLVKDEDGLFAVKQIGINIKTAPNPPSISIAPILDCIVSGQPFETEAYVYDRDLLRNGTPAETEVLTLTVEYPTTLKIEPATIEGPQQNDTIEVKLKSDGPFSFSPSDVVDGRIEVKVKVTDKSGLSDSLILRMRVSEPVTFISDLLIYNSKGSAKTLSWGTAPNATTGDGYDGQPIGKLDAEYCEIEIPNIPPQDVFDVRWPISSITATYRNIFPTAKVGSADNKRYRYRGNIQGGGETGMTPYYYPITLRWDPTTVPSRTDGTKNPTGAAWWLIDSRTDGSYFKVDMNNVVNRNITTSVAAFNTVTIDGTEYAELSIIDDNINAFQIIYDYDGDVEEVNDIAATTTITSVFPTPVSRNEDEITIGFDIAKAGNVYIEIFNDLGEKVATVIDTYYNAGHHSFDYTLRDYKGTRLSSGTYRVRLTSGMSVAYSQFIVLN